MRRSPRPLAPLFHLLRRSPARAGALAVGVLVLGAVAVAETPAYQARIDALTAKAAAARKRQGLDHASACAQDPTPEMTFEHTTKAKAGSTFTVAVPGHFSRGTGFVFQSDHVHVVKAEITAAGATVTGRVDAHAFPGTVSLAAVPPLCDADISADAVTVESATEWDLTLDNGWRVHLSADGFGSECKARWSGGGKAATMPCVLSESGGGGFQVALGTPEQQQARAMKQMQVMNDPEVVKAQGRIQTLADAMGKCGEEKSQDRQIACIHKVSAKVQAATDAVNKASEDALKRAMKGAFGCLSLDLTVNGSKVDVQASSCAYPTKQNGHGTVKVR